MRFDDLTPELIEQAKKCTTREERLSFIRDNEIELTDEQLEVISGGLPLPPVKHAPECYLSPNGLHEYVETGRKVPGDIFGSLWPNDEVVCKHCGKFSVNFSW